MKTWKESSIALDRFEYTGPHPSEEKEKLFVTLPSTVSKMKPEGENAEKNKKQKDDIDSHSQPQHVHFTTGGPQSLAIIDMAPLLQQ